MSHPMRNPLTVEAAYGVQPKAGYLDMGMTDSEMPANQHTLVEMLSANWELTFFEMNGVNGYVAPTTMDLQRLYDAATGANGDPTKINGFLFQSMQYDLILESPNDPRWDAFYDLTAELAKSNHPLDIATKNMFQDAKEGKQVDNVWLEYEVGRGSITEDDLKEQPHDGRLPLPDGSAPGAGTTPTPPEQPVQPGQPGEAEEVLLTDSIIELYIAYFNRAPEAEGFNYWKATLEERMEGGMSQEQALSSIAEQFWPSALAQGHISGYSESMSNWDFVSTIYANVLGRPDAAVTDQEGVGYWTDRLDSGTTKGQLVMDIINAAHDYIDEHNDQVAVRTEAYLDNRIEVGRFFALEENSGHLLGDAATIAGFNVMDELTFEYSTVVAAIAEIKARSYSTTKLDGHDAPIVNTDELSDSVIELYIAYFNRAPEAEGFNYWKDTIAERMEGGMSQEQALASIAEQFWPSALAQGHISGYSESMSNWDFVSTIYANVLGRPDASVTDQEGVGYWTDRLDSGTTKGQLVMDIINAAHDYVDEHNDQIAVRTEAYLDNRIEVGRFFALEENSGHLLGDAASIAGFNVMDELTYERSTVVNAIAEIEARTYSTTELDGQASARTMSVDTLSMFDDDDMVSYNLESFNLPVDHGLELILFAENNPAQAGTDWGSADSFVDHGELELVGMDTTTNDSDMFMG